jgi:hypothetical protein
MVSLMKIQIPSMKSLMQAVGVGLGGAVIVVGVFYFTLLPKQDVQSICEAHKQYIFSKAAGGDEAQLAVEHAELLKSHILSLSGRNLIATLPQTFPTSRRSLLEEAAKQAGLDNWSCPEMAIQ